MQVETELVVHEQNMWPLEKIISGLRSLEWRLQEAAIRQAQCQREGVAPLLLEMLKQEVRVAELDEPANEDQQAGDAPYLCACLLTEFKHPGTADVLLHAVTRSGDIPYLLFGDLLLEDFPSILAAWIDDPETLDRMIGDATIDPSVRWMFVSTMTLLIRDGRLTREEATERLQRHLERSLRDGDDSINHALALELAMYGLPSPLNAIREAFQRHLIQEDVAYLSELEGMIELRDATFNKTIAKCSPTGVEDTVEFAGRWLRLLDRPAINADWEESDDGWNESDSLDEDIPLPNATRYSEPLRRESPKIGRNDPCVCGSGKKYKKCCGRM